MSQQSWPRLKALLHTTRLGMRRLARTTVLCCNREGHARATDQAKRARQALGVHDRPWACTTEVRMRQGNSVVTEKSLSR